MRRDPHSYNDDAQPEVQRLSWRARIDFAARLLTGDVTLWLRAPAQAGPIDLDTRELSLEAVFGEKGAPLPWELAAPEPILGARLRVMLPAGTRALRVRYRSSATASALQWLEPAQTASGARPFLYSQCQAIHARSLLPLQDTPRVRVTYDAELTVPAALVPLMAAAAGPERVVGGERVSAWRLPQPIPPYLIAFAVGELAPRDLSPRCRVWAEPSVLAAAAWELAGVEDMLRAAEALFGPYDWERFDLLVMPPSFPYGGMENPRLTFLTPTVIAGDRSLTSVVAHELAHSWTGNLVSNASAEHFWLNEGLTVFAERRIVAALFGNEAAALQAALGLRALEQAFTRFKDNPELTHLHTRLDGIDPDLAFSEVPYEKGFLFLCALEEAVGREPFERFLRAWVGAHRFASVTSDDFRRACERELPGALARVDGEAWLAGPGLPPSSPRPRSPRLEQVEALGAALPSVEQAAGFSPIEWELYLESLPRPAPLELCRALDARFALSARGNYEVLVAWLTLAVASGYHPVLPRVEEVLGRVGRMKYLRPLYGALRARPETRALAERIYREHRDGYHPIARQVVEGLLADGQPYPLPHG